MPALCHQAQGGTSSFTCEAQPSPSEYTIWLLIFRESYPLSDFLAIRNILELTLPVATHHKDYFWRVLWSTGRIHIAVLPTDLTELRWHHQQLEQQLKVPLEAKAVHFKLNNVCLNLALVFDSALVLGRFALETPLKQQVSVTGGSGSLCRESLACRHQPGVQKQGRQDGRVSETSRVQKPFLLI